MKPLLFMLGGAVLGWVVWRLSPRKWQGEPRDQNNSQQVPPY